MSGYQGESYYTVNESDVLNIKNKTDSLIKILLKMNPYMILAYENKYVSKSRMSSRVLNNLNTK